MVREISLQSDPQAINERDQMNGLDRLLSCAGEGVSNARHIIDCVVHKLMAFTQNLPQRDDQTLLALRVK